ncbi:MAG: MarR family transcriptional regulator [Eubacterium sp.]|nr:MarR family transcriptional regulator [Eubacterium sp.]
MDKNIQNQIDAINQRIKELNSVYHLAAAKSGISDGEVCIWSALLNSDEEYSQQDLADLLFLPKQTVNSIISNLIKKGFVYLEHAQGTRNRKVVRLTNEGRAYGTSEVMWIFSAEKRALEKTDPEQVKVTIDMIERYISYLKKEIEKK